MQTQPQTQPAPAHKSVRSPRPDGLVTLALPAMLPGDRILPGAMAQGPRREGAGPQDCDPMSGGPGGPAAQWRRRVGTQGAGGRARLFQKTRRAPRGPAELESVFPSFAGSTMAAVKSLNPKAEVARAQAALAVNISAARGLQDVLRTNLGPKGTMKM